MDEQPRRDREMSRRLRRSRPVPPARLVRRVRERTNDLEARAGRPPYLWALVTVYLAAGLLLLVLAAASAAGGGAFS